MSDEVASTQLGGSSLGDRRPVVGYTAGVFDMFHIGHLNILRRASRYCDYLLVGITTDELCESRKKKTPIVPWAERAEIVRSMQVVDEVIPQTTMDKFGLWEQRAFDVLFVGSDWEGSQMWINLEARFAAVDVAVHYFPYTPHTSSSSLRSRIFGT